MSAMFAVLEHPAPVIAGIGGHAIAGGCVLALCCDMKIAEEGKPRIGLNEKTIGFPMPASIDALVKGALGTRRGRRLMKGGELYGAFDARELGLINRICPPGEASGTAVGEAGRPSVSGGKKAKAHIGGKARKLFIKEDRYRLAERLSAPETVDRLEALLQTLKKAKEEVKTTEVAKAKKAAKPKEAAKTAKPAKTKKAAEPKKAVKTAKPAKAKKAAEPEAEAKTAKPAKAKKATEPEVVVVKARKSAGTKKAAKSKKNG